MGWSLLLGSIALDHTPVSAVPSVDLILTESD